MFVLVFGKAHFGCCVGLEIGDEMGVGWWGAGGPRVIVVRTLLWCPERD